MSWILWVQDHIRSQGTTCGAVLVWGLSSSLKTGWLPSPTGGALAADGAENGGPPSARDPPAVAADVGVWLDSAWASATPNNSGDLQTTYNST